MAGAEKTLWSVLASDPNDEEALTLLGNIRGRQLRYAEAEALFRRVLQLHPKSMLARRHLAGVLFAQEKIDDAIEQSKVLVELAPGEADLRVDLARLYVSHRQFHEAFSTLEPIPLERLPSTAIPVNAASLLGVGRRSDAIALKLKVKASRAVALDLAMVFLQSSLPDDALDCLPASVPLAKKSAAAFYFVKGKALQEKGQLVPATSNLRKSIALDPKSTDALLALAAIDAAIGEHEESLRSLQRAHALAPEAVPVLRPFVVEALKAGQRKLAARAAYELQQKSPDNLDDLYLAGATMLEVEEYAPTIAIFEKYVSQRPWEPKGLLGLGFAYIGNQRFTDARSALERAVAIDPNLVESYCQLGLVASKEGKLQEAIQNFEHALQLQPRHAKALVSLGTLYIQQGELEKADEVFGGGGGPQRPRSRVSAEPSFQPNGKFRRSSPAHGSVPQTQTGKGSSGFREVGNEVCSLNRDPDYFGYGSSVSARFLLPSWL